MEPVGNTGLGAAKVPAGSLYFGRDGAAAGFSASDIFLDSFYGQVIQGCTDLRPGGPVPARANEVPLYALSVAVALRKIVIALVRCNSNCCAAQNPTERPCDPAARH